MTPGQNKRLNDWLENRLEDTPSEASPENEIETDSCQEWEIQSSIDTLLRMQENRLTLSDEFHEKLSRRIEDAQNNSRSSTESKPTLAGETEPRLRKDHTREGTVTRRRFRWWHPTLAAALVGLLLFAWQAFVGRYPDPKATGGFQVVGGGPLQSDSTLVTNDESAQVVLGGYCNVTIEPNSHITLAGDKEEESVELETGSVVCEVERGKGKFTVVTDLGSVSVVGTKFEVEVSEEVGEDNMISRNMIVNVLVGTVMVTTSAGQTETLHAGERTTVSRETAPFTKGGYLPGGEEVKKAVESRRGKTELSKLAAKMEPGTWAELKTTMPKRLWTSPPPSRGLHIAGWTDDAHWDSKTGQFLYMGLRQTRQFIAYTETNNTWRVIKLDPMTNNPVFRTKTGHIYETNGFDHERSRFYHYYRDFKSAEENIKLKGGISYFDVVTEKWTKLPAGPGAMALEYFGALDGLVVLGKEAKFFSNKRQKWESLGATPVDGYHSLMRHNPYRNEILMGGGNHNRRVVARITKEGKIERLKDFPGDFGLSPDKITIDPTSGRYLMFSWKNGPLKCFEFDSNENEYRLVKNASEGPYPYKKYSATYSVCAFIPEYGVVMWAEPRGVFLYKHDSSKEYPLAASVPQTAEPKKKK